MKIKILKHAGLVFAALAFVVLPTIRVGATDNFGKAFLPPEDKEEEVVLSSWEKNDGKTYCPESAKGLFSEVCAGQKSNVSAPFSLDDTERYVNITMHAGAHGHFDDKTGAERQAYTKTWYYMDSFEEYPDVVSDDSNYVFMGWATTENATEPNIDIGAVKAGQVGTDVYAIWSAKAYVVYHIPGGIWVNPVDGEEYQHVMMEYNAGSYFAELNPDPVSLDNHYNFLGWNTYYHKTGDHYDSSNVIDKYYLEVYPEWQYKDSTIEEMALDTAYEITAGVSVPVYRFTPAESGYYEVYSDGVYSGEGEAYQAIIRIQNEYDSTLAIEEAIDPSEGWGDVHTFYEMEAGKTYYIRFTEAQGQYLHFDAYIKKADMSAVTFNANNDEAWFGDDHSKKTIELQLPVGKDIKFMQLGYIDVDPLHFNDDGLLFGSWMTTSEPTGDEHSYLLVTGPTMTVYADFMEVPYFHFDFNGGHHPFYDDVTTMTSNILPWYKFESPIDPDIDDPYKDFAGWSRDPHATKPDEDIREGLDSAQATFEILNGATLYAVYDDKVTVTFKTTTGAYMLDDPNVTVFETVHGNGHVFYGMAVMHDNDRVKHEGWIDDRGNITIETSQTDGEYHVDGDTTFTAILVYELTADANGGVFTRGCGFNETCPRNRLRVPFGDESEYFSYADVEEKIGTPVTDEEGKSFIGYATYPGAIESNIIDGETPLESLGEIYAVYGEVEPEPEPTPDPTPDPTPESEDDVVVPDTGTNTSYENGSAGTTSIVVAPVVAVITMIVTAVSCRRFFKK